MVVEIPKKDLQPEQKIVIITIIARHLFKNYSEFGVKCPQLE